MSEASEIKVPNPEELESLKSKAFTRRVAIASGIFAVLLAFSTIGVNRAKHEVLRAQKRADEQWAFYQAKAGRETLYRTQKMGLELALLEKNSLKQEIRQKYENLLNNMSLEAQRYGLEKQEIAKEAKKLELEGYIYDAISGHFEHIQVFFQITIVMASIAIVTYSQKVFGITIIVASLCTIYAIYEFCLLFLS